MKAAMTKYTSCLILILVIGCKANDRNLSSIITSANCYWDIQYVDSFGGQSVYCYKFNKDGSCQYFYYDKKKARNKYDFDDNIPTTKNWQLQGDTALYIFGARGNILSFSKDTILLQSPISKETHFLIRDCK
jgi:hypothetical protein